MEDNPRPFFEHLEELRRRLIRSLLAVLAGAILAYPFVDPILRFLTKPVGRLIFLGPTEAFFIRIKIAVVFGVFLAVPWIMFEVWQFVVIALTPVEKKSLFWILPASYLLFALGAAFSLFILIPSGVKFLLGYGSDILVPTLSVEAYMDFVSTLTLILGALFQMPLVSFFLGRIGLLSPRWLSQQRKYAIVGIYIFSALITPGPDPVTAILLAIPTYLLFEISILSARAAQNLSIR